MSKYLSTTQISCPGSVRREESVSHGRGWTEPLPGTGTAATLRRLNSAPAERAWMGCPV